MPAIRNLDKFSDVPWCPFPSLVNCHAEQVDMLSFTWLEERRLLEGHPDKMERIKSQHSGVLAARTNPEVNAEMLGILSDWYMWLFAFDDGYCEAAEHGGQSKTMARATALLARVIDSGLPPHETPAPIQNYASALREIQERIRTRASSSQLARWETAVRDYLAAQVWEAANRESETVPGVSEYVAMRRHAGATYTCLGLIDIAAGYEIAPAFFDSPALRSLNDMTANLVSWDNDLYSYAKEKVDDRGRHNLIEVISRQNHLAPQDAKEKAVEIRSREMKRFIDASADLCARADSSVSRYVRSLGLWLRGHIDWSRTSSRFDVPRADRVAQEFGGEQT
ncbi:terpene synthase family protein [Streptomyces sp. NBC_01264]|uniref:terpene synthase family protein n=1 Tax=Streptomyces sp. NBC_01264 TaxID=2903804 RepID=UPI002259EAF7|nr:hypothetical protein [Streptomyces sp. NBC_01264]MCX4784544.1 hypothetical protein [Streptomyces sp. NBC_01264]